MLIIFDWFVWETISFMCKDTPLYIFPYSLSTYVSYVAMTTKKTQHCWLTIIMGSSGVWMIVQTAIVHLHDCLQDVWNI